MNINGTEMVRFNQRWNSFKYETNTILLERFPTNGNYKKHLAIYFTTTDVSDRESGYFKENCKNILAIIKGIGYEGLVIVGYEKLSDVAKSSILVGVNSGWIIEDEPLSTYIIEEIN